MNTNIFFKKIFNHNTIMVVIIISMLSGCDCFEEEKSPIKIGSDRWEMISANNSQTCGIKDDKSIQCYGFKDYKQIVGNELLENNMSENKILNWLKVSTGFDNACSISENNQLWCWGENTVGQIGNDVKTEGTEYNKNSPPVKVDDSNWKFISLNRRHTCGIKADNSLWCWGSNLYGQLGINSKLINDNNIREPVLVDDSIWESISLGEIASCGLKSDNSLWCWGHIDFSLSNSYTDKITEPIAIKNYQFKQIVVGDCYGGYYICGIKEDQTLWCWGKNDNGQLGDGSIVDRSEPVQIGRDKWKTVVTGWNHTCGIKADNSLWCWGDNESFKLGDGTEKDQTIPVKIDKNSHWINVTAGQLHTCGIKSDKSLWCWGLINSSGAGAGIKD